MARRKVLKLSNPTEAKRAISRVANMVLNGDIDPKTGNTLIYACNSAVNAIKTVEYQNKLEELEALLMEQRERK